MKRLLKQKWSVEDNKNVSRAGQMLYPVLNRNKS